MLFYRDKEFFNGDIPEDLLDPKQFKWPQAKWKVGKYI